MKRKQYWKYVDDFMHPGKYQLIHIKTRKKKKMYIHNINEYKRVLREVNQRENNSDVG